MSKAIGMIEFKTTSTGVTAADAMVKTSEVELFMELLRLRRSVRWEFLKLMMQLPLSKQQTRQLRLRS